MHIAVTIPKAGATSGKVASYCWVYTGLQTTAWLWALRSVAMAAMASATVPSSQIVALNELCKWLGKTNRGVVRHAGSDRVRRDAAHVTAGATRRRGTHTHLVRVVVIVGVLATVVLAALDPRRTW